MLVLDSPRLGIFSSSEAAYVFTDNTADSAITNEARHVKFVSPDKSITNWNRESTALVGAIVLYAIGCG
jgi:hypothetical protein